MYIHTMHTSIHTKQPASKEIHQFKVFSFCALIYLFFTCSNSIILLTYSIQLDSVHLPYLLVCPLMNLIIDYYKKKEKKVEICMYVHQH